MRITRTCPALVASLYILGWLMAYSLTGDITWSYNESLSIWLEFSVFGVAMVVSTTLVAGWLWRPETDDPDRLDKCASDAAKMRRWGVIAVSIIAAWALVRFLVSAAAG